MRASKIYICLTSSKLKDIIARRSQNEKRTLKSMSNINTIKLNVFTFKFFE